MNLEVSKSQKLECGITYIVYLFSLFRFLEIIELTGCAINSRNGSHTEKVSERKVEGWMNFLLETRNNFFSNL
jgi:hypothetical protein